MAVPGSDDHQPSPFRQGRDRFQSGRSKSERQAGEQDWSEEYWAEGLAPPRAVVGLSQVEGALALDASSLPDRSRFASSFPLHASHSTSHPEEIPLHRDRVVKQWGKALGVSTDAVEALLEDPRFQYLQQYFRLDQALRTVGGKYVISVDPEKRFSVGVLTTPDLLEDVRAAANAILPRHQIAELSQTSTFTRLVHDLDRLPADLNKISDHRFAKEVSRAMRDEVFPTLISGILGELGSPRDRGNSGFDILCEESSAQEGSPLVQDVEVKVLSDDSPIFNRDSVQGRKHFFKIVHILTFEGERPRIGEKPIEPRALLMQHTATDEQMQGLVDDLVSAGVDPARVILVDKSRLKRAGVEFEHPERNSAGSNESVVRMSIDLQQNLKREWALRMVERGGPDIRPLDVVAFADVTGQFGCAGSLRESDEEPLEFALMRASGTLELVDFFEKKLR